MSATLNARTSVAVLSTLQTSLNYWQLPPNSTRIIGFAAERALEIDLYLRAAVHRRCQRPSKGLGTNKTVEAS